MIIIIQWRQCERLGPTGGGRWSEKSLTPDLQLSSSQWPAPGWPSLATIPPAGPGPWSSPGPRTQHLYYNLHSQAPDTNTLTLNIYFIIALLRLPYSNIFRVTSMYYMQHIVLHLICLYFEIYKYNTSEELTSPGSLHFLTFIDSTLSLTTLFRARRVPRFHP